jgi:hypothetical protein
VPLISFGYIFIIHVCMFFEQGDDIESGVRLFQVQQSGPQSWQATEVELVFTTSCAII